MAKASRVSSSRALAVGYARLMTTLSGRHQVGAAAVADALPALDFTPRRSARPFSRTPVHHNCTVLRSTGCPGGRVELGASVAAALQHQPVAVVGELRFSSAREGDGLGHGLPVDGERPGGRVDAGGIRPLCAGTSGRRVTLVVQQGWL